MESLPQGSSDGHQVESNSVADDANPFSACNLCGRVIGSVSDDVAADPEIFSICGECKILLLEDFGTPAPPLSRRQSARRRRRRRRNRNQSSELVGDNYSQQYALFMNLTRSMSALHGNEDQRDDGETAARLLQRTSSHTTPSGSRRWRIFSESESEDLDNLDSRYGETESNASFSLYRFSNGDIDAISFSAYGGESDASTDRHGLLDAEIFVQPDDRSDVDFDTDIDPMHAGLNQWNSDEEDGEWEEADGEEGAAFSGVSGTRNRNYLASPSESNSSMTLRRQYDSPELERGFRRRIIESRQMLSRNIFTGLEDLEFSPYAANVGDYLDERGFEELLEQLAESDNSRRGAPPAAVSCVKNLPRIIISEEDIKKGGDVLLCAVCKELFPKGTETTQLPCLHLYHANCIVPWLSSRNSCPLCRYELPTDDKDYEERKQNVVTREIEEQEVSEDSSSDDVTEAEEEENVERDESDAGGGSISRGRWFFLAAAPVVSLVGVVLAMWLSNPQRRNIVISHNQRGSRTRRWLPFF